MPMQSGTESENEKYKIKILDTTVVKIGEGTGENRIDIEVMNKTEQDLGTRVTVTVCCGADKESLLSSKDDAVTAQYWLTGASESRELSDSKLAEKSRRVWRTSSRDKGTNIPKNGSLKISLMDFRSDTFEGDVKITVCAEEKVGDVWKGKPVDLTVAKVLESTGEPQLHFFRVDPDYILHAGQMQVTTSFFATGYETAILFRNNEQVKAWAKADDGRIEGELPDRPSITSVYRLQLKRPPKEIREAKPDLFWRTVQVISPGWNRIALPQGSPTRLFVANDFRGAATERLYGIFYRNWYEKQDRNRLRSRAGLYSSGTGVDSWSLEPGKVPEGMETSPGVIYKNRLWLIGGSAVDPRKKTKDVWCYEQDEETGTMKWNRTNLSFPPSGDARFGHCCVVLGDAILVLGGYDNQSYNDVWRLNANGDGQTFTIDQVSTGTAKAHWGPRCMHTAATVRSADGNETLWVYGGAESRGAARRYSDLWSTRDGKTWIEHKMPDQKTAIVPDPGEPVGSALVACPEGVDGGTLASISAAGSERLILLGSFRERQEPGAVEIGNRISSSLFEWQERTSTWESRPVNDGWQQFQGQTFSMHALAFNRFLYIYSLDQETLYPEQGDELVDLKLNIRIPS